MKGNFLEELLSEWYQYQGYFVRINTPVAKRKNGGYDCELDVVAFSPAKKHLVHIEASMDSMSWLKREARFLKKFRAGDQYIPSLFPGLTIPKDIEKIALLEFASKKTFTSVGGGKIVLVHEFLRTIFEDLKDKAVKNRAISESFLLLRAFQFVASHREAVLPSHR